MNTAHSPSILNSSASASWLPLCLPKYDPSGFVHVFVTFLQSEAYPDSAVSAPEPKAKPRRPSGGSTSPQEGGSTQVELSPSKPDSSPGAGLGLICVTANGDFESIRAWCGAVIEVSHSRLDRVNSHGAIGLAP